MAYQYDSLNRLIKAQATSNTWGQGFVYDGFGNLLQKNVTAGSAPALAITVNPANNQISSSQYGYDFNGNVTSLPTGTGSVILQYDIENRVSLYSSPYTSTQNYQYAYGAANQRVWKGTFNGQPTPQSEQFYFYGIHGELQHFPILG